MSFSAKNKPRPAPRSLFASLVASFFLVAILVGFPAPISASGGNPLSAGSLPPNEASVIGPLRSIMTSEMVYNKRIYHAGYSPTFASLGRPPEGLKATASHAGLLNIWVASGKPDKCLFSHSPGYIFTYTPGPKDSSGKITAYSVTARPVTWKKGVHSFFADQTGVIRWTDENRAPTATDPALN